MLTNNSIAFPALEYGPDHGDPRLRKHLASWLTTFFKPQHPITDDRIAISGGASQNLAVLLNVFTDPSYTRAVWFVAPAYHLSFRIVQDAGFHDKFRAIPEDDEGIDLEYFKSEVKKLEEKATFEGTSEPVSHDRAFLTLSTRTILVKACIANLSWDDNALRTSADSAIRNTNPRYDLGQKYTSMSCIVFQPSPTPLPKR